MAKVSQTKRQAATAIADASGLSVGNVLGIEAERGPPDDRRSRGRRGASRHDGRGESPAWRCRITAHARLSARSASDRKARCSLRYIEMEGDFAAASGVLVHALEVAKEVGFDDEEITMLHDRSAS